MEHLERSIAEGLLSIRAVFFRPNEPFTWASGIKSPVYCDNRLILTAPEVRTQVESALCEIIRADYPDVEVLMGTSTAGIAHAACGRRFAVCGQWAMCARPAKITAVRIRSRVALSRARRSSSSRISFPPAAASWTL